MAGENTNSSADTDVDVTVTEADIKALNDEKNNNNADTNKNDENTDVTNDVSEKSIQDILKECQSFEDLFKNETVLEKLQAREKETTDTYITDLSKRDAKIKELMDELKPMKAKFRTEEHMKLFNNGDVEGLTKSIEEHTSSIYKEMISQEATKHNAEKEELTRKVNEATELNAKLKDTVKNNQLEKFFSNKDINPAALLDAINFAKDEFEVDDELSFKHKVVAEFTVENWLEQQRTKRPYLFNVFKPTGVSHQNRNAPKGPKSLAETDNLDDYKKARMKQDGIK